MTPNPFSTKLKILHNKSCIARFQMAIYEAVRNMGYEDDFAERLAEGNMILYEGDQLSELEKAQIQAYYDEIFVLKQCNIELRAKQIKQTTLQTTNTTLSTIKQG